MEPQATTRDRILAAALDLFSTNGYADSSIREIAKYAGITVASIYNYFDSKEEILHEILETAEADYRKHLPQIKEILKRASTEPLESLSDQLWKPTRTEKDCKLVKLLLMMQYQNEYAASIAKRRFTEVPREVATAAMQSLIEAGNLEAFDYTLVCDLVVTYLHATFCYGLLDNCTVQEINQRCDATAAALLSLIKRVSELKKK